MATCPAQAVTFWNVFFQHRGCESHVPVTFPHLLDGLPGIRQLSFQTVYCLALNYGSLQTTPVASLSWLRREWEAAHLGR